VDDHLPRHRSEQPAIEQGMAAMADGNMIDTMFFGIEYDLFGRMADGYRTKALRPA
jgi:hypothetical protein